MTRILYIAPEYPGPGTNAAQVRAHALLPRLDARVELRTLAFPPQEGRSGAANVGNLAEVDRRHMTIGDHFLGGLSRRPRAFRRFDTPAARETLTHLLEEFRPDIVHFDSIATLALVDVVMERAAGSRIVAHTHDAVSQLYKSQMRRGGLLRLNAWNEYRKILQVEATVLSKVDLIIVDSKEDAAFLARQSGGTKVMTLPLGFDPAVFAPDGPKAELREHSIVFSGAMSGRQSVDAAEYLVTQIMPLVWTKHPDCHAYLVGNNPAPEVLALQGDRVHVTGFVEDLASYLRASTLYVCPLRIGSGMRTRVIEALACGAVIIATPFAMRGIGVGPSSHVPWRTGESAEQLSEQINAALTRDNTELRKQAAKYAQSHYSWDSVADELVRAYRKMETGI